MFAFVLDGALFEFALKSPALAPLFALPPDNKALTDPQPLRN